MDNSTLPIRHAGSPLVTNASVNRAAAVRCFKAGLTVAQIVAAWPEVFAAVFENGSDKLKQRYDYALADGSGRFETERVITEASVDAVLAAHTQHATCKHCDRRIARLPKGVWRGTDNTTRCLARSGARWSRHAPY